MSRFFHRYDVKVWNFLALVCIGTGETYQTAGRNWLGTIQLIVWFSQSLQGKDFLYCTWFPRKPALIIAQRVLLVPTLLENSDDTTRWILIYPSLHHMLRPGCISPLYLAYLPKASSFDFAKILLFNKCHTGKWKVWTTPRWKMWVNLDGPKLVMK